MNRETSRQAIGTAFGKLAELLGVVSCSGEPGRCRMELEVNPTWLNPNGVLHGGAVYTLIDYSMGAAVHFALTPGQRCATIEIKVSYLATVRAGRLVANTKVIKQGRNIAFTESVVTDDGGRLVASASGSMFIQSVPTSPSEDT